MHFDTLSYALFLCFLTPFYYENHSSYFLKYFKHFNCINFIFQASRFFPPADLKLLLRWVDGAIHVTSNVDPTFDSMQDPSDK